MGNMADNKSPVEDLAMEISDDEDDDWFASECITNIVATQTPQSLSDSDGLAKPHQHGHPVSVISRLVPIVYLDADTEETIDCTAPDVVELPDSEDIIYTPDDDSISETMKPKTKLRKNRLYSTSSDDVETIIEIDDDDENVGDNSSEMPGNCSTVSVSNTTDDIQQLLIYPPTGSGGISINTEDYQCLAKEEYLNDVIIDFYLKYLYIEMLTDEQRNRTHIFSTFFYKRLVSDSNGRFTRTSRRSNPPGDDSSLARHARVQKWTKHVNLFEKDFVFVPINEHNHWYLAVVCFPSLAGPVTKYGGAPVSRLPSLVPVYRPCILILDSMYTDCGHDQTVTNLQNYLTCEYRAQFGGVDDAQPARAFTNKTMPGHVIPVPQQDNYSDCGLFVLQFVEEFFLNPIKDFQMPIKKLTNWFDCMVVLRKREDIATLLDNLVREHNPQREELLPMIEFPTKNGQLK